MKLLCFPLRQEGNGLLEEEPIAWRRGHVTVTEASGVLRMNRAAAVSRVQLEFGRERMEKHQCATGDTELDQAVRLWLQYDKVS